MTSYRKGTLDGTTCGKTCDVGCQVRELPTFFRHVIRVHQEAPTSENLLYLLRDCQRFHLLFRNGLDADTGRWIEIGLMGIRFAYDDSMPAHRYRTNVFEVGDWRNTIFLGLMNG